MIKGQYIREMCYSTKWAHSGALSKANLVTAGSGEEKSSVYCKAPPVGISNNGSSCLNDPNSPVDFQEDKVRERGTGLLISSCTVLGGEWWASREMFGDSQSSTFCFQAVWSLHACGEHVVNFLQLVVVKVKVTQSCPILQLLWNSLGQNTGVGSISLL